MLELAYVFLMRQQWSRPTGARGRGGALPGRLAASGPGLFIAVVCGHGGGVLGARSLGSREEWRAGSLEGLGRQRGLFWAREAG